MMEIDNVSNLLRGQLENANFQKEVLSEDLVGLGGRSLTSALVHKEIASDVDPLGNDNKLIFATGLLTGIAASSVHRLSLGSISPLTEGIKESNTGGTFALDLRLSGYVALIIEGKCPKLSIIFINGDDVNLVDGSDYQMKDTLTTGRMLTKQFGKDISFVCIGPAGEYQMLTSSIVVSDVDGIAARHLGRGGLGAVMGSKQLKAIVIKSNHRKYIKGANPTELKQNIQTYHSLLRTTPQTSQIYTKFGTAAMVDTTNALEGMPTMSFRFGSHPDANKINGVELSRIIEERHGLVSHRCMPGCLIKCSNIYVDPQGNELLRSLEYETIILCGSNLGIFNLDQIAQINLKINKLGMDSIDIGGAIGVLMDAGKLPFGDFQGVMNLLKEIEDDTELGRLIGNGVFRTGTAIGSTRIPASMKQGFAGYDPRAIKGHGVTFATSTMGADHTAGMNIREGLNPHSKDGQVASSFRVQQLAVIYDSLGMCLFSHAAVRAHLDLLANMLTNLYGQDWSIERLTQMAIRTLDVEREVNEARHLNDAKGRLPAFMYTEKLGSEGLTFDIEPNEMGDKTT